MSKILGNYFNRKIFRIAIIAVIVVLVIYPFVFTKKSFANEISLFPTVCEGSWKNASEAAGDPVDNRLAGARSTASGDMITCHSFDLSSLPDDAIITEAHLELVWASGSSNNQFIQPSIEETYDPLAPVTEEGLINQSLEINEIDTELESTIPESEINTLETETVPAIEEKINPIPVEDSKIDSSNNDIISEPTSRIPAWIQSLFISEVKAEEIVVPVENSIISNDNQLTTSELEVVSSETEQNKETTSEAILPDSVTTTSSETGGTPTESRKVQTEDSDKKSVEPSKTIEVASTGTALFNLSYTVATKTEHHLGSVTQEHLSNVYPLLVSVDDVAVLNVSLTSLMTFDQVDNLSLEGMKLVVSYTAAESLDPIRQPDLEEDAILDDIIIDNIETIRIKRADNKQYEIWYRTLDPEELAKNIQQEETVDTQGEETIISNFQEISTPVLPELTKDEIKSEEIPITETAKPVIENSEENIISTSTNTINPESFSDTKTPDKKKRFYWNFVDGDDSVNRDIPLGLQDGYIFWLNKKGTVLNSFNILTQGYSSQSYQPENGVDFIIYRNPSSQERKAILNSEKKFIFSE